MIVTNSVVLYNYQHSVQYKTNCFNVTVQFSLRAWTISKTRTKYQKTWYMQTMYQNVPDFWYKSGTKSIRPHFEHISEFGFWISDLLFQMILYFIFRFWISDLNWSWRVLTLQLKLQLVVFCYLCLLSFPHQLQHWVLTQKHAQDLTHGEHKEHGEMGVDTEPGHKGHSSILSSSIVWVVTNIQISILY